MAGGRNIIPRLLPPPSSPPPPERRQTMLFSATTTKKVKDLETLALKSDPVYVGVDDLEEKATVAGLEQGYVELGG